MTQLHITYNPASNAATSQLDEDDQHGANYLADLKKEIEVMESDTKERKMGIMEWRRLNRIRQGSVENSVIGSYVRLSFFFIDDSTHIHTMQLECPTSIPWPNSSSSSFLRYSWQNIKGQTQHDADHSDLEKIKKWPIEYLAVVCLKGFNMGKEAAAEALKKAENIAPIDPD